MLIPFVDCCFVLEKYGKLPKGILHIGAHECEELVDYEKCGIYARNVYWVDAIEEKILEMKKKDIPNVYCAALDIEEKIVKFNITNNGQSSSLLELGTHKNSYPHIVVTEVRTVKTQTGREFIEKNRIPIKDCNFWNLDIQGKELDVLKSMGEYINFADAIYSEVNTQEVYKGGCLLSDLDLFLQSKGFTRVNISMTGAGWGDALYVRDKEV